MPPKSLINPAPPYPTKLECSRTQHATSPWLGEGRRGASLGLWRSLKGKLVVFHHHWSTFLGCRREKSLSSASSLLFFFMSRKRAIDSSRSCEGRKPGKTFFSTISSSDQFCQYLMPHTSSITYLITFLTSIFLHIEAGCNKTF